jgi:hypothetical protein
MSTTGDRSVGSPARASATPAESCPLSRSAQAPRLIDISPTMNSARATGSVMSVMVGSTGDWLVEQLRHWESIVRSNWMLKSLTAPPGTVKIWTPASSASYWLVTT